MISEEVIEEMATAFRLAWHEKDIEGGRGERVKAGLRAAFAVLEEPEPEPEQTEFYEVMGGQGLRRIAMNLTREQAEEVRDKFDHDCAKYGLSNPPTRINKQHRRYS